MKKARVKLVIRAITRAQIPDMVRIWKASGLPFRPNGRDSMRNLIAQHKKDPQLFIGAFVGPEMVGVVLASDDGRRAWINRLAVIPKVQRAGIAAALVKKAEDTMRRRGRRLFCVQIEDGNSASMRFFENIGYKREQEIFYFTKRELKSY